jgi:hypothetical protein
MTNPWSFVGRLLMPGLATPPPTACANRPALFRLAFLAQATLVGGLRKTTKARLSRAFFH